MATKKKLIEMDAKHQEWLKRTARDNRIYEKDVIFYVFDQAIKSGIMDGYKKKAVASELQRTLDQLAQGAKTIAALQERSEKLLREAEESEGKDR